MMLGWFWLTLMDEIHQLQANLLLLDLFSLIVSTPSPWFHQLAQGGITNLYLKEVIEKTIVKTNTSSNIFTNFVTNFE